MANDDDTQRNPWVDIGPALKQYMGGDPASLTRLPARERRLAERLAPFLAAATASTTPAGEAPPLDQDPMAIALGLVAGPDDVLSAARFKVARQRVKLDIAQVASRLADRGWDVSTARALKWQQRDTRMAPALLNVLAQTLSTTPAYLRASLAPSAVTLADLLRDETIAAVIEEWARETGRSSNDLRSEIEGTLAGLNYRNEGDATREAVLAVIKALRKLSQP